MPDIQQAYYHGIRQQIRRVVQALGPNRTDDGLTAFVDGASSWSSCFFARALPELNLDHSKNPSEAIRVELGLETMIPVRITWNTFDGCGVTMSKDDMRKFIEDIIDETRPQEVLDILRSLTVDLEADIPAGSQCRS